MAKDWTGNKASTYKTLGASNHTDGEREENDYYATEPFAADLLCGVEKLSHVIWECACGEGHLSRRFSELGHRVYSSDLINRNFGIAPVDFLTLQSSPVPGADIVTNPPYKFAEQFIRHALTLTDGKVCMFLKLTFLEGQKRKKFFQDFPPYRVYVSSSRLTCAMNGDFVSMTAAGGSAAAYAWYVWPVGYKGDTVIKWIN